MEVYSLPFGKVVCPICMDATYFETFRIARERGADIAILPIANLEEYNLWKALRGIWPRVQESYLYGLKSSLNGWIFGRHFTGKAGIFAPWPMTPNKDGVLSSSLHPFLEILLLTHPIDIFNIFFFKLHIFISVIFCLFSFFI